MSVPLATVAPLASQTAGAFQAPTAPAAPTPLYAHPLFQQLTGGAWRPGGLALTRHGLSLCGFAPGMCVADVGCGAGATLEILQAQGMRVVGLDIAPPRATPSRDGESPRTGASLICAHAGHLPLAAEVLDGLVCECVLSLLKDAEAALAGFARVLRPGGALLLSDLFRHDAPLDGSSSEHRAASFSCMEGALPRQTLERALTHSGFHREHFEDHTALLRPLAAQLLWHGLRCPMSCPESFGGAGGSGARMGYGLWIARRTR